MDRSKILEKITSISKEDMEKIFSQMTLEEVNKMLEKLEKLNEGVKFDD